MKFSIFTPTHRPAYLMEAYQSLCKQTAGDWEWVIVENNGGRVPDFLRDDSRIIIKEFNSQNIGALKRFACESATGDVFVELDHDDMLMPNALELIAREVEQGAEFVYSDFVEFKSDGTSNEYGSQWGWVSRPVKIKGRAYQAMRAFECNARTLFEIFYAPNHVRAWVRSLYERIGKHDSTLSVCDDHDLVCRTYLSGAKIVYIPECIYLYRVQEGSGNTTIERNALIQEKQAEVGDKYFDRLVEEWARRSNLPMYDLGGRTGCPKGYKSIDLRDADVIHDLRTGLPFETSSVGVIRAFDFLEHIPQGQSVINLMNEIYRVLVPGGWLLSHTPSTEGRGAFQDPTHVSFWNSNSFWYYTKRDLMRYVPDITCRFQLVRIKNHFPSSFHEFHKIPYVRADLCALKGQRQAGIQEC